MTTTITQQDIQESIRDLGLSNRPVCLHSSLNSFGHVAGGAQSVVEAFVQEDCTVLVPTFTWSSFAVPPPFDQRPPRNGWNYEAHSGSTAGMGRIYTPALLEIDSEMGIIAATVVASPGRARGNYPLCSFAAVGPLAEDLMADQSPGDVYAPLATLTQRDGAVLLMGVGLERMTLLHLAEKAAGRTLFRRWANDVHGQSIAVETGGCSDGFGKLEPHLQAFFASRLVGQSLWQTCSANEVLHGTTLAIRNTPYVTHCDNQTCERCNDAVAGGPMLLP
jgi:aminoglycoside N3'-acetyltransferase